MPVREPLAAYGGLWFAYFATIGVFNPYAPLWFKSLGLSIPLIGAIASLQSWTRVLAPYGWSWLADHSGQRVRLIQWAAAGACLSALALALSPLLQRWLPAGLIPWLLPLWVGLLFMANGGLVPLAEAALAQLLARGSAQGGGIDAARYGRVRVWGSLGFVASVVAAGPLLQALGIGAFALLVALANAALLAVALRLPAGEAQATQTEPPPPIAPRLAQPVVRWFFASVFFTVLAHVGLYAFFSLYLDALGHGKSAVGGLWAVAVLCEMAFFYTQGRWLGRMGPLRWLALAAAASVLRFAVTAAAGASLALLVACQALHALSFAAHHTACIHLVTRWFPGRLRGRGQALYSALGYGLSGVLGGLGGGWLFESLGPSAVFWAASLSALLALACVLRMARLGLASADLPPR